MSVLCGLLAYLAFGALNDSATCERDRFPDRCQGNQGDQANNANPPPGDDLE